MRLALDKAWAAEKEMKREMHGLRAEKEALDARLGDGEAAAAATASTARELATREAMLHATQRQLEDSLTRSAHEVRGGGEGGRFVGRAGGRRLFE